MAREMRMKDLEGQVERLGEKAAAYEEAYEKRREVRTEGDRTYVALTRDELEARVKALESREEEAKGRHRRLLRQAQQERDALQEEVKALRGREQDWDAQTQELARDLAHAESEK
ncbi:unnamed protein product, partial [Discosporangium mesarthrocarpum]